jgi:hypothetical protein
MFGICSGCRNLFPLAGRRAEDEKPRLFEILVPQPPREPGRMRSFLIFFARNPLKKLDSEK